MSDILKVCESLSLLKKISANRHLGKERVRCQAIARLCPQITIFQNTEVGVH